MLALVAAAALAAQWQPYDAKGRWAKPTAELAAEWLPPELAADAASHEFGAPVTQDGEPLFIQFVGHGRDGGDGFCVRKSYYVGISGGRDGGLPHPPVIGDQVRLGNCDGIYAHVNPGAELDAAKRALRWLEWAQGAARTSSPLPFRIACKSETDEDRCAGGARKALAALPLGKTFIVSKDWRTPPHLWHLAITETEPGQLLWDVKIDATPGEASVDLRWIIPPPF